MEKIALAADSTSYLPKEVVEKYNIHIVPLNVVFGNETYKEDIELGSSEFYKKVRTSKALPTTSQPAIGDFISLYEKLVASGYEDVILVTLSSHISGTYQTATMAGQSVEGIRVHVFDSEIAALAEGFFVLEAAQMIEAGKSVQEILDRLKDIRERGVKAYFMVDDLNHLHRGGRLTGAQAFLGSLLKMKPILTFKEKKIVPIEKIRTKKRALNRLKEYLEEDAKTGVPIRASVITAEAQEDADALAAEIRQTYPNVEVDTGYLGAVIGTHTGEGTIGLTWYTK
ncbi:DegV family protein [Camelliibacillus cellulosilyticus]|uniref:DegV family protein n=1 Tax=Camelliibacillus cellulosilyticus TaxID=2174486 RepID=A0ABV9GNN6_9BACL